jgi:hypothetical protein
MRAVSRLHEEALARNISEERSRAFGLVEGQPPMTPIFTILAALAVLAVAFENECIALGSVCLAGWVFYLG